MHTLIGTVCRLLSLLQESGSPMRNLEPGEHLHFHDLNLEAEPLLTVSVDIVSPIALMLLYNMAFQLSHTSRCSLTHF